jgi:hypothetical protein
MICVYVICVAKDVVVLDLANMNMYFTSTISYTIQRGLSVTLSFVVTVQSLYHAVPPD